MTASSLRPLLVTSLSLQRNAVSIHNEKKTTGEIVYLEKLCLTISSCQLVTTGGVLLRSHGIPDIQNVASV